MHADKWSNSSITGDGLVSYPGHTLGVGPYPCV